MEEKSIITMPEKVSWNDERVLTTAQLAEYYGTSTDNIKVNFNRNRDRFVNGKHFYKLEGDELRTLKREVTNCYFAENVNVLYLWTKRGAARHAKMLNTDEAWEVFEKLEDNYFDRPAIASANNTESLSELAAIEREKLAIERERNVAEREKGVIEREKLVAEREKLVAEREKLGIEREKLDIECKKLVLAREINAQLQKRRRE